MFELIAELLLASSLAIMILFAYKGHRFSVEYADYHSGQIVVSIAIIDIVSASISFLTLIYAPYKLDINISFTESTHFNTGLHLFISTILAYFVSSKAMQRSIDFFMKEGELVRKRK